MSGGTYNYFYHKLSDFASEIYGQHKNPRRAAFAKLMSICAEAAHDIEWVDSGDYGPGDEHEAIDKVFSFLEADPITTQKAAAYDKLKDNLKDYLDL